MLSKIVGHKRCFTLAAGAVILTGAYLYSTSIFKSKNMKTFIGDNQWIDLPISKIETLSHDTKRFTFKLPSSNHTTGLVVASAILAKYVTPKGSNVIRPYTPITDSGCRGEFQLIVKHYEGGKFTTHLFNLKENDTVSFKGPVLKWKWESNSFDDITCLCAGTGITPLYQLIQHIVNDPTDKTKIRLYYGNKTPADILLKKELDNLQKKFSDQLSITYFVDNTQGTDFEGEVGFISKHFLSKNAPKPEEKTQVFVCGPGPFMDAYSGPKVSPTNQGELTGILSDLGYSKNQVFKF